MLREMKTKDLELISSYLDGELPPEQISRLEQRIQADPELRAALEALQQTRALLRRMPRRRVPRNFTLSPRQVAKRPPLPRFYLSLQWSTALTVLLLVFSLGLRLISPPAASPVAQEAAPALRAAQAEMTEQPLTVMALPPEGTPTPEAALPSIMALPQETPQAKDVPPSLAETAMPAGEEPMPSEYTTPVESTSPLRFIWVGLGILILLQISLLFGLRWWSAYQWRKRS